MFVCLYVCLFVCLLLCACGHARPRMHLCARLGALIHANVCLTCLRVRACVVCGWMCVCVCVRVFVRLCVACICHYFIRSLVCVLIIGYVCVCMGVCVSLRVCVCGSMCVMNLCS